MVAAYSATVRSNAVLKHFVHQNVPSVVWTGSYNGISL